MIKFGFRAQNSSLLRKKFFCTTKPSDFAYFPENFRRRLSRNPVEISTTSQQAENRPFFEFSPIFRQKFLTPSEISDRNFYFFQHTSDRSPTSHNVEFYPPLPWILSPLKDGRNFWGKIHFFQKKHFEISKTASEAQKFRPPKKFSESTKWMLKKLLTTKNVVFQHLLPVYETIFEIFLPNFGQKMAFFGSPRQKFLPPPTSGGPISKKIFQKNTSLHQFPTCAKYHRNPPSSL